MMYEMRTSGMLVRPMGLGGSVLLGSVIVVRALIILLILSVHCFILHRSFLVSGVINTKYLLSMYVLSVVCWCERHIYFFKGWNLVETAVM